MQVETGTSGLDELGDEIFCGVQVALYVPPQVTEMRKKNDFQDEFYSCLTNKIFKILPSYASNTKDLYLHHSVKNFEYIFLTKNCTKFVS